MKDDCMRVAKRSTGTKGALAALLISLLNFSLSVAASQTATADLLKKLNLSGYSSVMRPPDFQARTSSGEEVSMRGLSGKVLLINFWATWCLECRTEMPALERLHREFGTAGLRMIGINVREGPAAIRAYAKDLGLTFPLLLDPQGKVSASYGVIGLPTTFLVGRDGRAIALAVGPRDWASPAAQAIIEALLAEPPAAKGKP